MPLRHWIIGSGIVLLLAGLLACVPQNQYGGSGGYGNAADIAYAHTLWRVLEKRQLAGEQAIQSRAFAGRHPHGELQQLIDGPMTIAGQRGRVIVLRNYAGDDASSESVADQPHRFLTSIAVMFKRPGYNPVHGDWFWAEFQPYGRLAHTGDGTAVAGRVTGCSGCHRKAGGGNYVFDSQ